MLSNKNQKYIFERLLKGLLVAYQPLDEDRFVFTDFGLWESVRR